MSRPHAASIIEDSVNRRVESVLRRRGWSNRIIAHTGYGSTASVRVLARVLLTRTAGATERAEARNADAVDAGTGSADAGATIGELQAEEEQRRGWRAFITAQAMDVPVSIAVGDRKLTVRSDRGGYIDVTVTDHGLAPGWQQARISAPDAGDVDAAILVVGSEPTLGIISDIDDTVISTSLPRPLIAAWNTFVRSESARSPVPGMAEMYRSLLADHPHAPIVYVSTGAWNTAPTLTRFLKRHRYPVGPMLLTDWGPTNTGWFRSGQEHKRACLRRLVEELPNVHWVLVGDDGQHDPTIYGDFSREHPDRVDVVAIRELTPTQQVLSHGTPVSTEPTGPERPGEIPVCRAGDGAGLQPLIRRALTARSAE